MALQKDFDCFLSNIEPSKSMVKYISSIQNNLRAYLKSHDTYTSVYKDTFLSGSYAKHTSIRPIKDDKKRDVDIVVVTNYSKEDDSSEVLQELYEALLDSPKYNNAKIQHHSVSVEMNNISIDVVPVISDPIDDELYWIGDSENGSWSKTDPKGHKTWSTSLNQENNKKYKPLIKIFKWWRHENCPDDLKYPKGITLEKIIADQLGDSSLPIESFLIETMQKIVKTYKKDYADQELLPVIEDPSEKIKDNDLLDGYSVEEFSSFIYKIDEHVNKLNESGTSNSVWREILGSEFPQSAKDYAENRNVHEFTAPHKREPSWPMARDGAVLVSLIVTDSTGNNIDYESDGDPLPKGCSLDFRALTGVKKPFDIYWQITNTGNEARLANCLRGNFEESDIGLTGKKEATAYSGRHSVQCFVIKGGICRAKSKDYIINII